MKSIVSSNWLRRAVLFFVGGAIALTVVSPWSVPSLAVSKRERIAQRMVVLQKSNQRWIEVNLSRQRLIAWEGGNPVYAVIVSTGKRSTPTRTGTFAIESKARSARMQGQGYNVANVPFTMYYSGDYAIHGAYWHRRFGTPVSHGCINVAVNHAEWLFRWASIGTSVVIHE